MRTTLTLDPDLAERLRKETANGQQSFKKVVNEKLRIGLGMKHQPAKRAYKVKTINSPYRPGIDRMNMNKLADELEVEAIIDKLQAE